ncbi:hypothetical protein M422DRAFT_39224, partial [Sphaerobolus stellatus SS14]
MTSSMQDSPSRTLSTASSASPYSLQNHIPAEHQHPTMQLIAAAALQHSQLYPTFSSGQHIQAAISQQPVDSITASFSATRVDWNGDPRQAANNSHYKPEDNQRKATEDSHQLEDQDETRWTSCNANQNVAVGLDTKDPSFTPLCLQHPSPTNSQSSQPSPSGSSEVKQPALSHQGAPVKDRGGKSARNKRETSIAQYQSTDRVSVRLVARGSNGTPTADNTTAEGSFHLPFLEQPSSRFQDTNENGKRSFDSEEGTSENGHKRKKSDPPVPTGGPYPYQAFGMPVHIPMHISLTDGIPPAQIPVDPAFFMGEHSYLNLPQGVAFQGCPPPLDPSQPPQSLPPPYFPPSTLAPELQNTRCMSGRYKNDNIPRCVACIRRWAGDTCRFQGVRFLLRDTERRVQAITFVDHQAEDSLSLKFPTKWNVPLDIGTIRRLKLTVAKGLLPFLKNEQLHMRLSDIIRRPRETDVRVTCDTCMTSIFSCDWMCRACGRESCSECIQHVRDLTYPTRALTAKGEKKKHPNASFLTCVRRTEHSFKDFSPVSRFCMTNVDDAVLEMEAFLADSSSRLVDDHVAEDERSWDGQEQSDNLMGFPPIMTTTETSSIRTSPEQPTPRVQDNPPATGSSQQSHSSTPRNPGSPIYLPNPSVAMPPPATGRYGDPFDPAQIPKAPFYLFQRYISDEQFRAIWATGQPLVVSDLLDNFSIRWTPQYFVDNFGHNKCLILDCHTDENKSVLVENFFSQFGKYTGRNKCWKLKDWPPSSDFSQTFPELFDDFSAAVPVPNYTRRDGSHNIASHFPSNTIAPDLGPKMYNAF